MRIIGSFKKSDIGKFKSMNDVKLHERAQRVQDELENLKNAFAVSDNSEADFNSEEGVVLLDRAIGDRTEFAERTNLSKTWEISGLLDDKSKTFEATQSSSNSYSVGESGGLGSGRLVVAGFESLEHTSCVPMVCENS